MRRLENFARLVFRRRFVVLKGKRTLSGRDTALESLTLSGSGGDVTVLTNNWGEEG